VAEGNFGRLQQALERLDEEPADTRAGFRRAAEAAPGAAGVAAPVLALAILDGTRIERQPGEDAVVAGKVTGAEGERFEARAFLGDAGAQVIGGGTLAGRRDQLQSRIAKLEERGGNARIRLGPPIGRAAEQRGIDGHARLDIGRQQDNVIEATDHCNSGTAPPPARPSYALSLPPTASWRPVGRASMDCPDGPC